MSIGRVIPVVLIVAGVVAVALKDTLAIPQLANAGYALVGAGLLIIASGFFSTDTPKKK